MRAGEVARRAGVNVETLRYYQRRGLLPEPTRMPGGHRRYDEDTVRFLCAVKEAQAAGFTLAELTADQLESLWPSRTTATPRMLTAAVSAWDALSQPEPSALATLATAGIPELPFAGPALRRLLEELPAPRDGLSGTERRTLQAIAAGAVTPGTAFRAAQDLEAAPFLGDTWFYRALATLGRGPGRLIQTRDGEQLPPAPAAGRRPCFHRVDCEADPRWRAGASGPGRSGTATRGRPLGRRNPYHPGHAMAMGPRCPAPRGTSLTPGRLS